MAGRRSRGGTSTGSTSRTPAWPHATGAGDHHAVLARRQHPVGQDHHAVVAGVHDVHRRHLGKRLPHGRLLAADLGGDVAGGHVQLLGRLQRDRHPVENRPHRAAAAPPRRCRSGTMPRPPPTCRSAWPPALRAAPTTRTRSSSPAQVHRRPADPRGAGGAARAGPQPGAHRARGRHGRVRRTGGQGRPPPNGEAWPASPIPAGVALRATPAEHRRSPARLSVLQHPHLPDTAAALPHAPGSPRLGVLRRLRPAHWRSIDDGPSLSHHAGREGIGRPGTVPVFTVIRSSKEEPDSAPAASLRVRRRLPRSLPVAGFTTPAEFPTTTAAGARRSRPRSTRFEPV
jgi:hypothetical protein